MAGAAAELEALKEEREAIRAEDRYHLSSFSACNSAAVPAMIHTSTPIMHRLPKDLMTSLGSEPMAVGTHARPSQTCGQPRADIVGWDKAGGFDGAIDLAWFLT